MLELKLQYFGHLMQRASSLENTLMLGETKGRRRGQERMMVGWHHRFDGHEFEQALGNGEGQRSLACCSPWGHKETDMTERLNTTTKSTNDKNVSLYSLVKPYRLQSVLHLLNLI